MQRVKVGMTGLALVLLLIALASAIFKSASKERSVDVAGGIRRRRWSPIISITNDSAAASDAA